ncbi:hypothetical protein H4582DRAFT_2058445 [Lactarius indigo]|nr:hypothetical protein H4582DRAFT_2058445 [Lactarius indigo]
MLSDRVHCSVALCGIEWLADAEKKVSKKPRPTRGSRVRKSSHKWGGLYLRREQALKQCGAAAREEASWVATTLLLPARRSSLLRHVRSISQNQPERSTTLRENITMPPLHFIPRVFEGGKGSEGLHVAKQRTTPVRFVDRRSSPYEGEGNVEYAFGGTVLDARLLPRPRGPKYLAKYVGKAVRYQEAPSGFFTELTHRRMLVPSAPRCILEVKKEKILDCALQRLRLHTCEGAQWDRHSLACRWATGGTEDRRSLMPSGMVSLAPATNHVVHSDPPNPGSRAHALVGVGCPGVSVKGYLLRCRRYRQKTRREGLKETYSRSMGAQMRSFGFSRIPNTPSLMATPQLLLVTTSLLFGFFCVLKCEGAIEKSRGATVAHDTTRHDKVVPPPLG